MNEHQYIIDAFTKTGDNTNLEVNNLNANCITSKDNKFELDSNGNLTVQSVNASSISIASNIYVWLDAIHPVGSIYMSVNDTNPSQVFGGQWEQIKDTFLLACGDTYANATTGGEANHVLTTSEMPTHSHTASTNNTGEHRHAFRGWWTTKGDGSATYACVARSQQADAAEYGPFETAGDHSHTVTVNNTGEGQAHNNMPPYLAVYVWKRIS